MCNNITDNIHKFVMKAGNHCIYMYTCVLMLITNYKVLRIAISLQRFNSFHSPQVLIVLYIFTSGKMLYQKDLISIMFVKFDDWQEKILEGYLSIPENDI